MSIFIVRHGETHANAQRVIQVPDAPLSPLGVAQAERVAKRLAQLGVGRILSSDLARARLTAERVAAATGVPLEPEPLLQERNFGDLRGRAYDDVEIDIFAAGYAPPGGEDWEAFHRRVDAAWERVAAAAGETAGNLAVITHGLVCYSIAARHLELPPGDPAPMRWANTSLTIVEGPPWGVRLLNCDEHLVGAEDAGGLSGI